MPAPISFVELRALLPRAPLAWLVASLLTGCAQPPPQIDGERPTAAALNDLIEHRGVPGAAEDWSFVPFADRGAWFGFALPPTGRSDLDGGFIGPFLMADGRWLGAQLARLTLSEADSGAVLSAAEATEQSSASLPGSLSQRMSLDGIDLAQELWFDSMHTAVLRTVLTNRGDSARRLRASWAGSVFTETADLGRAGSGVVAQTPAGASLYIDADRETSTPEIDLDVDNGHYVLPLAEPIELAAGEGVTVALALTLHLAGDPAPEHSVIAHLLAAPDSSRLANRERWGRYLAALDTGRAAGDPIQILVAKSLETLVGNWRGPTGRMRFSSLFPSCNVGYFNGFWAWDSWKHAVGLLRFDPGLAKDQVRAMFDHQDETGMIADVVYLDPTEDNWRDSKPPLAGWAIETIFEATGDLDFVRGLYPRLVAYHEFWYSSRDHDGDSLCEYGSTDGTLAAARWESGMDNAVRFDDTEMVRNGPAAWSMNQESVDLNSYLYREKLALERLATALGRTDDATRWSTEAAELRSRIQQTMFDAGSGWFYDIDLASEAIVPVQGPEGWIPLWAGVATAEQAAQARRAMLDAAKFRTHVPFPTVAADDPGFSDGYWRGLVWLDQAYFAIAGLRRYGYEEDAEQLTRQLFANLEGATTPGVPLRENYHPLTGRGQNVNHFSWTAAHLLLLALDLAVDADESAD
jgi:putative isomerase